MSDEPQIVVGWPPNIEAVRSAFPLSGFEIFAWSPNIIYNPSGNELPPWLIEHERVHFKQQNCKPEEWWDRYLVDAGFRLNEELEAHRVEYRVFCRHFKDRNTRCKYLHEIADRIASPMYGGIIAKRDAVRRISS